MRAAEARVLLTGAYGGIGEASAAALMRAGASLLLTGRSPARLAAQARTLMAGRTGDPRRIEWHSGDLANPADMTSLCEAAMAWECNVIIHAAGVAGFGRLEAAQDGEMARLLQVNLLAPMLLTQKMLPHLRSVPKAQVICIGSVLGCIGLPGFSVYSASKFGLRGFAEALRRETADTSVRVQYLGPRSTRTRFNSREVEAYNRATGTAMDDPETVARAVVQMLESVPAERLLGFPEKIAARINGLAPAMLDGAFAKHRRSLPAPPDLSAQPAADTQTRASATADSHSITPLP
ncbi:SDR family oxidoreductase [Variovorax sp. JS1663]|uniref:SDR family oxidoreductase n=1 Tax=Variovorax sp. JS1663 TaxID=1851577 RepID=UPI000B345C83|nr:SDR family oxidoreductase [Variovorax sp. JS1663]OUM00900.1 short chain dehydrogenase [Variovorax sp. JS1663]